MEYVQAVEALRRSMKYKAHYLGAKAVIHFHMELKRLKDGDQYRLSGYGTAIDYDSVTQE